MNITYKQLLAMVFISSTLMITGCENQGPAEKAGERLDEAVDEMKDELEGTRKGPLERAGENIDDAMAQTKSKLNRAMEKTGEKFEEIGEDIKESAE